MTPERRAHNMLHLPLWVEWEKLCAVVPAGDLNDHNRAGKKLAITEWEEAVYAQYGMANGTWDRATGSHYTVGDDYYERYERYDP